MNHVWQNSKVPSLHKFLLIALADNANQDGEAYPSIKKIANKMNLSERTVQRMVHDLELEGELLVTTKGGGKKNVWSSNLYLIPIPENIPTIQEAIRDGKKAGKYPYRLVTEKHFQLVGLEGGGDTVDTTLVTEPCHHPSDTVDTTIRTIKGTTKVTTKKKKDSRYADSSLSNSDLSGKGESPTLAVEPDKMKITLPEAVAEVWGKNKRTNWVMTQLLGTAKDGERKKWGLKKEPKVGEESLRIMDTVQEVLAFKAFWDECPDTPENVPETASILYERIDQFRRHTDYDRYMEKGGWYEKWMLEEKAKHSPQVEFVTPVSDDLDNIPVNEDFLKRRDAYYAKFK